MNRLEYLQGSLKTEDGQRKLVEWLHTDTTQLLLSVARELSQPRPMVGYNAIEKVQALGESVGANTIIGFFENPAAYSGIGASQSTTLGQPDYGAVEVMKEYGNE